MINQQYLQSVQAQLGLFAAQDNFESIIFTAFGDRVDLLLLQDLRQQWLTGDFSVIPEIRVLENGELGGAAGAYAAEFDQIFVAANFLNTASESSIKAVLLEEVGHRIDRLLNRGLDSAGDEGEIFAALVRGDSLTATQVAVIKAEDDHATAVIKGQVVAIETARFSSPSAFAVGVTPIAITVGDFNGDGKQDLATANLNDSNLSVLFGNGNGGFTTLTTLAVSSRTSSITVGDFNNDGKQDLAATHRAFLDNRISVLLGNGSGGFTNPTTFDVGMMSTSITVGDFNGDGKQDLVTANFISNSVSVLLGIGNGSFSNSAFFSVGDNPNSVTVGDFNNDGKQDLAVANSGSNSISILRGNGLGNFSNSFTLAVGSDPTSIAVGDFNNDGKQDLATAILNDSEISVSLGTGIGSFTSSANLAVSIVPRSVTIGDFNNDGKQDLAAAGISHGVSVLLGNGSGGFTNSSTLAANIGISSIKTGDFNGDGKQDLATIGSGNNVSVLLNTSPIVTISPGITPQEQGTNGVVPFNPLLPPIIGGFPPLVPPFPPITGGFPPLTPPFPLPPSQLPPSDGSFTINLDTPAPAGGLVVNFSLTDSSATFGIDYTLAAGAGITAVTNNSFSIAGGMTTATLIVSPINDGIPEFGENVQISLQSGNDYILGASAQAILSIIDSGGGIINDTIVLGAVQPISYTDTTLFDTFGSSPAGILIGSKNGLISDPSLVYGLVGGLISGSIGGNISTVNGVYGTLSVNTQVGVYTYTPNNAAINAVAANSNPADNFIFTLTDNSANFLLNPVQQPFTVSIVGSNDAPTLVTEIGNQSAGANAPFSFTIPLGTFADVDVVDTLTFSATLADDSPLPTWLNFDGSTGVFSGTPTNENIDTINIKVTATDTSGAFVSNEFNFVVTNSNNTPTLVTAIDDQSADEDTLFSFTVPLETFADVDAGDTLALTATLSDGSPLPSWLTFDVNTSTFSGTPINENVGTISIKVTATDTANAAVSEEFNLVITNTNDAPTLAATIADKFTVENAFFSFTVPLETFADIDAGDTLIISATLSDDKPLPAWLSFDSSTGVFSGTPTNEDVGNISVKVTATDIDGVSVSDDFNLIVTNINNAPTVTTEINDLTTAEDAPFSFTIPLNTFADVDAGDNLALTATLSDGSLLPGWLTFNANTGNFSGTPANENVGTISVKVTATDAANTFVSDEFDLVISNTNDAPTLAVAIANQSAAENTPFSFTIPLETFADIDADDTLIFSASLANGSPLPSWLTFNVNNGTFSGTPTSSDVRTISVRVTATDSSSTFVSDEFNLTVADITPPSAPLITNISNDTGLSNADRITSDNTLILSGTAEANSTVQLFRANASIGSATANASGNWSFDYTATALTDGTHNFTATAADAAGNTSLVSTPLSVTVDTTAPNQIATITGLSPDPGASSTDFLTNDGITARTYSGALSAALLSDETLQISVDGGTNWSDATANGTNWTFIDNSTQSNSWTIQARVIDLAGNSGLVANRSVTLDQQISAASEITLDLLATSDSGTSEVDNITRFQTPTFAVTFDLNSTEVGDIVEIRDGSAVLGNTILSAAQVSVGVANIALTATLANGLNTLSAVHRDRAGNSSTGINTLNVISDQQISAANAVTLDLLAASDSGASPTDNVTNIAAPTIAIAFDPTRAQAGDTLELRKGSTVLGAATLTVAQINAGIANVTLATALTSGLNTLSAVHRDVAGNNVTGSTTLAVTLDTTAPAIPVITGMSPDPGSSSTDFFTNNGTTARTYNGTLPATGVAGVQISIDGGVSWSNAAVNGNTWTFLDSSVQSNNWTIRARAVDIAGNFSSIASRVVTLDQQISAASEITLDLSATRDSGISNTDNITRFQTPIFAVTFDPTRAQAGDVLEIRNGAAALGAVTLMTAQVNAGTANVTLTTALVNGLNTLSAIHRDRAGNISTGANTLNVTLDQQISAANTVTLDLLAGSDSGVSQIDNITNLTAPTFALTFDTTKAQAGDILEVRRGSVVLATTAINAAQANAGIVNLTLATALTNGSNILAAVHRDVAGNTVTSTTLAVTHDTVTPTVPVVLGYSSTSVTGTAPANTTLLFSTSASLPSSFAAATAISNNNYVINTSSLLGSSVGQAYYLYAQDVAGNLSLASPQRVVVGAANGGTLSNVGSASSDLLVGNNESFHVVEYAISNNTISLTGQISASNVTNKSVNIRNANIDVLTSIEQLNFIGSSYSAITASAPGLNQLRGQVQNNPAALLNNSISAFTGAYDASVGTFSIGSANPNATLVAFDANSGSSQNYEAFLLLDKTSIGGSIGINAGIVSLTL